MIDRISQVVGFCAPHENRYSNGACVWHQQVTFMPGPAAWSLMFLIASTDNVYILIYCEFGTATDLTDEGISESEPGLAPASLVHCIALAASFSTEEN